ncbi:BPM2 [Symbiodinium sp. CCMP2592]|nr:BPM2 [Symbiodinium sp. CCMP2592]
MGAHVSYQVAGPASVEAEALLRFPPQRWSGWGCSLSWQGKALGCCREAETWADLLFSTRDVPLSTLWPAWAGPYMPPAVPGLGLSVARYNIGGCGRPEEQAGHPYGGRKVRGWFAEIEGYQPLPGGEFDWTRDEAQRNFLHLAIERGVDQVELFSNAPMWWMSNSTSSFGGALAQPDEFASYLGEVTSQARSGWGVPVRSVAPFNEPSADWWSFPHDQVQSDELRAKIQAALREAEAEEARRQELLVDIEEAEERQWLRRELERTRERHMQAQKSNRDKVDFREYIDKDISGKFRPKRPLDSVMQGSGAASTDCAETVVRGEYVWRITGFSWLKLALDQQMSECSVWSPIFELGDVPFQFAFNPVASRMFWGDYYASVEEGEEDDWPPLDDDAGPHGSLGIVVDTFSTFVLRYRIFIKAQHGEFVQWDGTQNVIHYGTDDGTHQPLAFGPDVHWPDDEPPGSQGIFGLSYEELLQSEWVMDDTLTVKFELEVLPEAGPESESSTPAAEVPEPTMTDDMCALLEEGSCSDVRLMVQEEVIQAHSQVLCARSEVFRKQLTAGMQESVSKVIVIEDCDVVTFKAFLQFLYTDRLPDAQALILAAASKESENGSCDPQLSQIQALLVVSHKYQVKRLQLWCEAKLSEEINASRVCSILVQAHLFQAKQLEKACLSFIKAKAGQVLLLPAYADLSKKWPQIGLKVSLFLAGVSETASQDTRSEEPAA